MYRNAVTMMDLLQWGLKWTFVAFCAAVVKGLSPGTRRLELFERPARTTARTGTGLVAVVLATPLLLALEVWWAGVQSARRGYTTSAARKLIIVESSAILLVTGLYSAFAMWLLRLTWRKLDQRSMKTPPEEWERAKPDWKMALLLIAASILVGRGLVFFLRGTIRNYEKSLRGLGLRRFLRGIPLMILLRLRQPHRDFFMHTPVIGEMWIFAICAGAAAAIPIPVFAVALPSMVAAISTLMMLDKLRPPTLFFLGASEEQSFRAFYTLRLIWGPTAVTLLDRDSEGGQASYQFLRHFWEHQGSMPAGLFYDPSIPRVWSLRTRPDMWEHSVLLLMDYAPVVVVDVRYPSEYVWHEVRALTERELLDKTWFLIGDQGPHPELAEVLPAEARLITEEALYEMSRERAHSYRNA